MTLEINVTADQRARILGALRQLAGPLEVQPGCLLCRILEDLRAEGVVGLAAKWDSEADLERYVGSKHFWKILTLMEVSRGKPEIRFHTISSTTGLETVERIRGTESASRSQNYPEGSAPAPRNG